MSTQKNAIQKGNFIYVIYKSIPKDGRDGELRINIQHKEKPISDVLMITWKCDLPDTENRGWRDAKLGLEHNDFFMLSLYNQLASLPLTKETTFEQILDLIHQNEIEQGLLAEVKDEGQQTAYDGFLSQSEIKAGSFIRNDDRIKFIIQKEQQKQLIEELEYNKITNINLLLKLAE